MAFDVAADRYDRFMGRYSALLSGQMADLADMRAGQRALDVGCGPGALTSELVARLGPAAVAAVDPSEPFVAAAARRNPGVDVRLATAEALPFERDSFDAALAQLVVHFMADPVGGIAEMARVTRAGGRVVACVWDFAGGNGPISALWEVAHELDRDVIDESDLPGARQGHLVELFGAAGLSAPTEHELDLHVEHPTFEDWWEPFTLGVGPAGQYVARLDPERRDALRDRCLSRLGRGPFVIGARAWAALGMA
jgi:SAM-dependent methyltransferase